MDYKELECKRESLTNNGFFWCGETLDVCRHCNSLFTERWGNYRQMRVLCVDCGNSYFISITNKRTSTRLHNWSLAVRRRDGFMCRKCGSREKLNAHHIKPFADFPELRFDINNGITLCEDCHKKEHKK